MKEQTGQAKEKCPWCKGTGQDVVEHSAYGPQVTDCPDCDGTGERDNLPSYEALAAQNAALREALKELLDAEWMMSHDWGGDRQAVLQKAKSALEGR